MVYVTSPSHLGLSNLVNMHCIYLHSFNVVRQKTGGQNKWDQIACKLMNNVFN